jgi:hypothetical protein
MGVNNRCYRLKTVVTGSTRATSLLRIILSHLSLELQRQELPQALTTSLQASKHLSQLYCTRRSPRPIFGRGRPGLKRARERRQGTRRGGHWAQGARQSALPLISKQSALPLQTRVTSCEQDMFAAVPIQCLEQLLTCVSKLRARRSTNNHLMAARDTCFLPRRTRTLIDPLRVQDRDRRCKAKCRQKKVSGEEYEQMLADKQDICVWVR